mmetsp:Transcript_6994/g.8064  ORF Transcript_6994/g.8064 Transcript_6994/m.8064 type:complete len:332 (+) Transcript_6994:367-1362(+)
MLSEVKLLKEASSNSLITLLSSSTLSSSLPLSRSRSSISSLSAKTISAIAVRRFNVSIFLSTTAPFPPSAVGSQNFPAGILSGLIFTKPPFPRLATLLQICPAGVTSGFTLTIPPFPFLAVGSHICPESISVWWGFLYIRPPFPSKAVTLQTMFGLILPGGGGRFTSIPSPPFALLLQYIPLGISSARGGLYTSIPAPLFAVAHHTMPGGISPTGGGELTIVFFSGCHFWFLGIARGLIFQEPFSFRCVCGSCSAISVSPLFCAKDCDTLLDADFILVRTAAKVLESAAVLRLSECFNCVFLPEEPLGSLDLAILWQTVLFNGPSFKVTVS